MALITDYASLQTEVANLLARTDLSADIPGFIQRAEAMLRRDSRARLLVDLPLTVDAEDVTLPTDFGGFEHISHDGPTYYHPIGTAALADLPSVKAQNGSDTGVPTRVAIVEDATGTVTARFAPEPDATYNVVASYWSKLTALSAANTTNRFLADHPDIYLYAAAVQSAPHLKDDPRLAVWKSELEGMLNSLFLDTENKRWGGTLTNGPRRQF